jgi:hypothetical protein
MYLFRRVCSAVRVYANTSFVIDQIRVCDAALKNLMCPFGGKPRNDEDLSTRHSVKEASAAYRITAFFRKSKRKMSLAVRKNIPYNYSQYRLTPFQPVSVNRPEASISHEPESDLAVSGVNIR